MKLLIFNFFILAVIAGTNPNKGSARQQVEQWQANTNKQCTRYRIMAKAVFEGDFPARVVLGIPENVTMTENIAIMNIRKGCREMCGGQCTYRGEDLFNGDLCEEFEGTHGAIVPEMMVKPPKPHFTGEGSFDFDEWEPESDWEQEYVEWDPFWWMEAEKERQEEKDKLKEQYGADYKDHMDYWMTHSYSEGSLDWEYYGYTSDWYDDFSFHNMEDWWQDFEDSWASYEWDDTMWDEINYDDIHGDSSWGDDWWDSDSSSGDYWWDSDSSSYFDWWDSEDGWYSSWDSSEGWTCEGCANEDGICGTSDDCGGGFCNMDGGEFGGWCEPCRAETDQECIDEGFVTDLGTTECQITCVAGQGTFERKLKARKLKARRKMGRALPKALQTYMSNHACGANLGDSPECKKAKEDFSNADGMFEEMKLQGACLEHCDQACGFLVNSVSFLLISLCYGLFNETN